MDEASEAHVDGVPRPPTAAPVSRPSELQPGALALLDAARALLLEGGFDALRIEAVAREAGVNKAMIRYYFGDKAGLVAALVDDLLREATVGLVTTSEALPQGDQRLHAYIAGTRAVMETPEFLAFFDVLPHALRDPELRRRIADLYIWYREMNLRCFEASSAAAGTPAPPGELVEPGTIGLSRVVSARHAAVASLVVAAVDGLAIQAALAADDIDLDECFAALEQAVRVLLTDDVPPGPAVSAAESGRALGSARAGGS